MDEGGLRDPARHRPGPVRPAARPDPRRAARGRPPAGRTRAVSSPARGSGYAPRASTRTAATPRAARTRTRSSGAVPPSLLQQVLPELRAALTAVAEDARHVMVVTDADGVLLWREGSTRVRHRADALGLHRGRALDRGGGRDERDRHRAGRGRAGADLLRRALRAQPPRLDLHGLPRARPAQRRAARRRRRQRARRDRAPDDRRARRHGREARRGEPVALPRAGARRAAHGRRAGAGGRLRAGAGRRRPRLGRRRARHAARGPGRGADRRRAGGRARAWGCACPSRSRAGGCCARARRAGRRCG